MIGNLSDHVKPDWCSTQDKAYEPDSPLDVATKRPPRLLLQQTPDSNATPKALQSSNYHSAENSPKGESVARQVVESQFKCVPHKKKQYKGNSVYFDACVEEQEH